MADHANITFYKIERCGYYNRSAVIPKFGNIGQILPSLKSWSQTLPLEETKVGSDDESDTLPTYIAAIDQYQGDWCVALWNEAPPSEGGIATIAAQSAVGAPDVKIADLEAGRLAGFATYFWILPKENVFATLRFDRPFTGQRAFQKYIKAFVRYYSKFVVHDAALTDSDDIKVLGYREIADAAPESLIPSFRAAIASKPGEIDFIASQSHNITAILHSEQLTLTSQAELKRWQKALIRFGIANPQRKSLTEATLKSSVNVRLTKAQVQGLAAEWQKDGGTDSGTDIGFKITGESSPRWFSKSIARDTFNVNLVRTMPEIFDLQALLKSLAVQRQDIVKLLA
ncbi:hypothetical protein [Achromobacter animicus]|uniref:hypothetical protein n=1 Tax=Achromobacter animicus TaxID=1389935 RepID=UPI0028AB71A7|nr:hypothetical protein [Achromobacter animicus]